MIKPAYSFSFLLSINIFVWQNVLYFLDAPRIPSDLLYTGLKRDITFYAFLASLRAMPISPSSVFRLKMYGAPQLANFFRPPD